MASKTSKRDKGRTAAAAKARVTRSDDRNLGESWVIEEEKSDVEDDGKLSDEEEEELPPPSRSAPRRRTSPRAVHTGTADSEIFPGRMSSSSEFKMPVLDHSSPPAQVRHRKPAARKPGRPRKEVKQEADGQDGFADALETILAYAQSLLLYVLDIVGIIFLKLKAPIAYLAIIYLLVGVMVITSNLFTNSIYTALSPVCRLPGVSLMSLPFCENDGVSRYGSAPPPPEFDRLMDSQSKFEEILASSAVGVTLPADMKRSEAAIRDLRTLVKYSSLKSRNELALEFDGFIETARIASKDLQTFNAQVGRAADSIISTAKWTQRTLDDVEEHRAARGAIAGFLSDTVLAPFMPPSMTPTIVLDQYVSHTRKVEDEINQLLEEALALLMILQNLEERLDIIHDISVRDGQIASVAQEELLSQLWTMLGGNKSELRKFNRQLDLLRNVGEYRKSALAHVTTTVLRLQAMNAELEELRERVGSTELLMDRKDVPLSVHLEAIQMGVERLEIGRSGMRQAQGEYYNRAMGGGFAEADGRAVKGKLID